MNTNTDTRAANGPCVATARMPERAARTPPARRSAAGNDSGTATATPTAVTAASAASNQNTPRQPPKGTTAPPTSGAITGATDWMAMSVANALATPSPRPTSTITDLASTTPAAPKKPWATRPASSTQIAGASAQTTAASAVPIAPARRRVRRPVRSEIGPITSWPSASDTMNAVSVSCAVEAVTPNSSTISGSAGR